MWNAVYFVSIHYFGFDNAVKHYLPVPIPLDGNYLDLSGNGYDLVPSGNPSFDDMQFEKGVVLDGNDWFTIPENRFLDGYGEVTISTWFIQDTAMTTDGKNHILIAGGDSRGGKDPFYIQMNSNKMNVGFHNASLNKEIRITDIGFTFQPNQLYHLSVSLEKVNINQSRLLVYIDNQLVQTVSSNYLDFKINYDVDMHSAVGMIESTLIHKQWFIGNIDDLRIYDRVLSSQERDLLYNGTFPDIYKSTTQATIDLKSNTGEDITISGNAPENAGFTKSEKDNLSVLTHDKANIAIDRIDKAIDIVSEKRGNLGAVLNRLDPTISNLQNSFENLSAANSRLLDADYAKESAEMAKSQILMQAGVGMMAQTKQLPDMVLQLIQQ